jgi:hypothetical protein
MWNWLMTPRYTSPSFWNLYTPYGIWDEYFKSNYSSSFEIFAIGRKCEK